MKLLEGFRIKGFNCQRVEGLIARLGVEGSRIEGFGVKGLNCRRVYSLSFTD